MFISKDRHPDLLPDNTNTSKELRILYPHIYSNDYQPKPCENGCPTAFNACYISAETRERILAAWKKRFTCLVVGDLYEKDAVVTIDLWKLFWI